MNSSQVPHGRKPTTSVKSTFLIGIVPLIAYVLIEEFYGPVAGLIAGIALGVAEIAYEYFTIRKVQSITWISNALVILLGTASLFEENSALFKLQPAIMLGIFGVVLFISSLLRKPFLLELAKKQNQNLPKAFQNALGGINFRASFFLFALSAVSVYSAFHWSTRVWALLKSVGMPVLFMAYLLAEFLVLRIRKA